MGLEDPPTFGISASDMTLKLDAAKYLLKNIVFCLTRMICQEQQFRRCSADNWFSNSVLHIIVFLLTSVILIVVIMILM